MAVTTTTVQTIRLDRWALPKMLLIPGIEMPDMTGFFFDSLASGPSADIICSMHIVSCKFGRTAAAILGNSSSLPVADPFNWLISVVVGHSKWLLRRLGWSWSSSTTKIGDGTTVSMSQSTILLVEKTNDQQVNCLVGQGEVTTRLLIKWAADRSDGCAHQYKSGVASILRACCNDASKTLSDR